MKYYFLIFFSFLFQFVSSNVQIEEMQTKLFDAEQGERDYLLYFVMCYLILETVDIGHIYSTLTKLINLLCSLLIFLNCLCHFF